jgi:hypothetical protein
VQLKPGHAVLGNLVYTYRTRMDVGGGVNRDVDVVISSTDVASLNGNTHGVSSTGHINVVLIYAAIGTHYTGLEFAIGTFVLTAMDGGTKMSDGFALMLTRPDGTLFHATALLNLKAERSSGWCVMPPLS